MDLVREVMRSLRAHPGFGIVVLLSLATAGLIGLMVLLMQVFPGFLGMAHFTDPSHRTHELTYSLLFGVAVIGMLAQLRRPSNNVAGMVMAVVPWVGLLLAAVLAADAGVILSTERMLVAALTVIAAILHPARGDFFRSLRVARVNWMLLALVIVAAAPLLIFASANIGLQRTSADDHAGMGHYGFMAAFSFTAIVVGLVASLRPAGWRLTAWVAGFLPALFGLTSVIYPDNSSSLGLIWAFAAIAWGVVFVAVAEFSTEVEGPEALGSQFGAGGRISTDESSMAPDGASPPALPRWLKVSGIVVIVLAVVAVGISIIAGVEHGPGRHGSGGDAEGNTPPIDGAPGLALTADELTFDPDRIELISGEPVNVTLTSADTLHDLVVDEIDFHLAAERDEAIIGGLVFDEPGTYTGYCSVEGHREAGMELEIVVRSSDGS